MVINNYAPVIIPTLNRFEHFQKCLESLEACTGSNRTEVYVGLDYPPSEKYIEGWKRIDDYLKQKEQSNKFLKFTVFRRTENCGVGNKNSNASLLINYVLKNNDKFIFSEDDNVFSVNFLEYINKGLCLFKDNKEILGICGYRHHYPLLSGDSTYIKQNVLFSAWGYGMWADRYEIVKSIGYKDLRQLLKSNFFRLFKCAPRIAIGVFNYTRKDWDMWKTDNFLGFYMCMNNMFVINPAKSCVRNIGMDGSGQSAKKASLEFTEKHSLQEIDNNDHFDYKGTGEDFFNQNRKALISGDCKILNCSWATFIKYLVKFIIVLILGEKLYNKFLLNRFK